MEKVNCSTDKIRESKLTREVERKTRQRTGKQDVRKLNLRGKVCFN